MLAPAARDDLERQLATLRKLRTHVDPQDILEAVECIMGSLHGDGSVLNGKLHDEIQALADYIGTVKAEIAAIRADEINEEYLPSASDELSAIVNATEQATNAIFEAVESIEALTEDMPPDVAERVAASVTSIYEACGFQDITGQRVTKVVGALQNIEGKVQSLLQAFGEETDPDQRRPKPQAKDENENSDDKALMNGPQLPGNANTQAEIDALLASFD